MDKIKRQILQNLLAGPKSIWHVLENQEGYLAQLVSSLQELAGEDLIGFGQGNLFLTTEGQALAKKLALLPREKLTCPQCQGRGIIPRGRFQEVLSQFTQLTQNRPQATSEYDQGFVPPEVTVARVMMMYLRGDLEKGELLLVGDDDLTSIAAALTGLPKRVQVAEIDRRLVDFINCTARSQGWEHVSARELDVREPLPHQLAHSFTTVFTDPVETLPGITLFLSRCAEALQGPAGALYFGLTTLESSPKKRYQIEKLLLDMGLVITDIIPRFHSYLLDWEESICKNFPILQELPFPLPPPKSSWYTSSLIRSEVVEGPIPAHRGPATLTADFYFDQEA